MYDCMYYLHVFFVFLEITSMYMKGKMSKWLITNSIPLLDLKKAFDYLGIDLDT